MAPSRSRGLAARAPLPAPAAVVPAARGADRGRPVRPAGLGVHARLRVPGRVAGDAHRQDDDQADAADRLGHGRADHQARLRRRARPRPAERPVRHRDRRGQLEAPAQLPHARRRPPAPQVVWGCEGKGEKAADRFFEELDPEPAAPPPPARRPASQLRAGPEPAIMVPFGPCPTVPAGHGIPAAGSQDDRELDPAVVRARLQAARRLDGHDRRLRHLRPPPRAPGDHLHRPLSRGPARQPGAGRGPPRLLERAALPRRPARRQALQGRPLVRCSRSPRSSPTSRPPRSPG